MLDAVADEVRALVGECYQRARTLLQDHRWRLDSLAERLLEAETLDEQEIYAAAGIERTGTSDGAEPRRHMPDAGLPASGPGTPGSGAGAAARQS
jgi:cell division protease FtsH